MYTYEVTCDRVGAEGSQVMIISSLENDVNTALSRARAYAVHAMLFKGLVGSVCNVPPLVNNAQYMANEAYFRNFFSSNIYSSYIVTASDEPRDVMRSGDKVKVFTYVSVNRNQLRQKLIEDKVIEALGGAFTR
jgi:hypothetical protein